MEASPASLITNQTDVILCLQSLLLRINRGLEVDVLLVNFKGQKNKKIYKKMTRYHH